MGFIVSYKRQIFTFVVSVVLSILLVASISFGVTYVDTDSVGVATATPGAYLAAKGDILGEVIRAEDHIRTSGLIATSTAGVGTSTVSATLNSQGGLGVDGSAIIGGVLYVSTLKSTSTTDAIFEGAFDVREAATSSFIGGATIATTTIIDNLTGRVGIGTTTLPDAEIVAGTFSVDPALTVSGAGGAASATGTVYITGGGANGGQIVLKGSNGLGSRCVSLIVNTGATDVGGSGAGVAELLVAKVVACPE